MKKDFLTGIILLLPFAVTLAIVVFIINLLTSPFEGVVESILRYYDVLDEPFLIFSGSQVLHFSSKLLALLFLVLLTIGVGFLAQMLFVNKLLLVADYLLQHIPMFNKLYKAAKDVVHTIFGSKKSAFEKVVLVPFPAANAYSIGLLPSDHAPLSAGENINVFVPGGPNPTMGFMLSYKYEEIIVTSMTVEEAFKFIVSLGIMYPDYGLGTFATEPVRTQSGYETGKN